MSNVISMDGGKKELIKSVVTILENGVREMHHSTIAAHLPFMVDPNHRAWCTGGVWGFVHVMIKSLKDIVAKSGGAQLGPAQYKAFKDFVSSCESGLTPVKLFVWFEDGFSWQMQFTKVDNGDYIPINGWVGSMNVFENIINDCANHFEIDRDVLLSTWIED